MINIIQDLLFMIFFFLEKFPRDINILLVPLSLVSFIVDIRVCHEKEKKN